MRDKHRAKRQLIWVGVVFVIITLTIGIYLWRSQKQYLKPTEPLEKVAIAAFKGLFAGPIYIAFVNGYFENEGLEATITQHKSGKATLNSLIEGKVDLATVAETPLMHASLKREKIYIVATFVSSKRNLAIIAKSKTLTTISALKGKKIGVTLGTNGDFFMDTLIISHGIRRNQVEIVNLNPDEMVNALMMGKVDAVSTWNPHVLRLRKESDVKGIISFGEGLYTGTFNIGAMQDFVNKNPEIIKKFLRAMIKAEDFIRENPDESCKIIADSIKADKALLNELWKDYKFLVTLDQTLLINMENQARWAVINKLTDKTEVPNYLNFIYFDGLEAVKPEAVTIIH